jgi:hypothetical protein
VVGTSDQTLNDVEEETAAAAEMAFERHFKDRLGLPAKRPAEAGVA